jgi:uracil-DNA glycosylase
VSEELFPSLTPKHTSKPILTLLPRCEACGLYNSCKSPKMPVDGRGEKKILVIGESPGKTEDQQGRPFIGPAGKLLSEALTKFGVDLRRDCWITNSAICHPKDDQLPEEAVEHCRPNVIKAIKELRPEKILLLGSSAVKSVLGWLYKPSPGGVHKWAGFVSPVRSVNAYVMASFHPAAVLRQRDSRVMRLLFDRHLEGLLCPEGRPYDVVLDLEKRVRLVYNQEQACTLIRQMIEHGRSVSFDYETTHKTPYALGAAFLSCALSDGEDSFAFPWTVQVEDSMREFLTGPNPKIGQNVGFEHKWGAVKLGVETKRWVWDCMLNAHALDNRKGITGLKHQAFSVLGYSSYDEHVEPYRTSKGPFERNRLHELPVAELLRYNVYDALFTWEVAQAQTKILRVRL